MDSRNVGSTGHLVGREDELRRLLAAIAGSPAVVLIEGEAGIGKTRLVAELRAELEGAAPEVAGRLLLIGGCGHIREPFPLGSVVEALRGAGEHLAAADLSLVTGALRPLLPELAHLLPGAPEPLDEIGERHRVFRGLADLLGSLGRVVLVLEDTHWADEQTTEFLGYLLSDPPAGLCVVLTFRSEEVGPGVRAVTARLPASVTRVQLTLPPFDTAATKELAASVLGAARVSEDFAVYLRERTSGLPFAIQELLALLRARNTLVRLGGRWARKAIDELDVPSGVRDSVLERVSRMSADARAVVEAAAVLQVMAPVSTLVATCRIEREEALAGLDEALERGLFVERTGTVGFRHLLAVQAVYGGISLPRRQDLHARAAAAVRRLRPVPLGQVAHHLRHADQLDAWVDAAEQAADQAIALGDSSEAARLLEAVLRHAELDTERSGELALKLGRAVIRNPRATNVIDLISDVLKKDLPRPVRGELHFLLGLAHETAGSQPDQRRRAYAEAVKDLDGRPDLALQAMMGLGLPTAPDLPLTEHLQWLERALDQLPAIDDSTLVAFALGKIAMVLTTIGDPRWAGLTETMLELTGGSPTPRVVSAFRSLGEDACYAGHHEVAEHLLTGALTGVRDFDVSQMEEFLCRAPLVALAYVQGAWDGLDAEAVAVVDRLADLPRYRLPADSVAACLALARGELDLARRLLDEAVDQCMSIGEIDVLPLPLSALLRLATAQGDGEAVLDRAAAACEIWEAKQLWPLAVRVVPPLVEAMVAAGPRVPGHLVPARPTRRDRWPAVHGQKRPG
ncbi:AAA family ATPase, partial [Streptosporangium canum]|uniref:ATP-binding protein n=1 Tax=Streptosporangium canum TaxID=324952 RepID=UPI003446AFC2